MQRDRAAAELKRLPMYPLSVNVVFSYLLRVELEWSDLRRIVFGLVYGLPTLQVEPLLISHQLRGTIFSAADRRASHGRRAPRRRCTSGAAEGPERPTVPRADHEKCSTKISRALGCQARTLRGSR